MGMGGVQRTAKFVKYLPDFGWEPYVLTTTPKVYLAKDECLIKEVENKAKIYRTGHPENKNEDNSRENGHTVVKFKNDANRKLLSNIAQTFLIPDSKILWKISALKLAEKIIREEKIDLLYATAPPYTDFLIASDLKKKFGIPLVIDYRDSWIDCPNNFYPTSFHKERHRKLETKVLKCADKVITINSRIKELILYRYNFKSDSDIEIIPQGFDQEDFDKQMPNVKKSGKMKITYSGSFLNYYTPKYFLDGLAKVFNKRPELKDKIEALFIGTFPEEFKDYIEKLGIASLVNIAGYVEHSLCVKYLLESDVLWMMINKTDSSDLHSTGKLYEYFGARKPILACVPEGVARESLKNYGAVKLTEPDDSNTIAKAIEEYYELYSKDNLPVPNEDMILQYDRKKLTGELAAQFDLTEDIIENEKVLTHHL